MSKNPTNTRDPDEHVDQQLGVMLTKAEKAAVRAHARALGLTSMSAAGRILINRGLAVSETPVFSPIEEQE